MASSAVVSRHGLDLNFNIIISIIIIGHICSNWLNPCCMGAEIIIVMFTLCYRQLVHAKLAVLVVSN